MMRIHSVSEVIRDVKTNLETLYPDVWVEGEVSNLNCHSSGHCYFTLKDAGAQLSAVIFRDDFRRLRFQPENGLKIVANGRVTIYPPQGRFQMVATHLEPVGKGGLQLAFEQLKIKLASEGLFADERKKPIPAIPQWIGIVTSLDGGALHDMLSILNRRFAGLRILISPVQVQGEGAAADIVRAIEHLNHHHAALDVLLIGRGGGSIEDLWAFNEEILARAIAASRIPIISCVGHETDFTIADFVADLRAPTPSAAAELVTRAKAELIHLVQSLVTRLARQMEYQLADAGERVERAWRSRMLQKPLALVEDYLQDVDVLRERMAQAATNQADHWQRNLSHRLEKLHLLSPLATLSRGYAIAWQLPERRVIKDAASVKAGDTIEVQVSQGRVYAQVERTDI